MLDHLGINCRDLAASAAFYDRVLGVLGHRRLMDFEVAIGYGTQQPSFWISAWQEEAPNREIHVAFTAPDAAPLSVGESRSLVATEPPPAQRPELQAPQQAVAPLDTLTADRGDDVRRHRVGHHDLEPHLGHEVHDVSRAAIHLGLATRSPEPFDLVHGHAGHPDLTKAILHFLELERLDDGFDLFHDSCLPFARRRG